MKKVLFLAAVAVSLFAARYPIVAEYSYMKGCVGNKPEMMKYCGCTLSAIESKYTLNEFITLLDNKQKFKEVVKYALSKCIDQLDFNEINK